MKLLLLLVGLFLLAFAINAGQKQQNEVLLFTGNTLGYLAPCGCSEPMIGGVKRRATVFRQLTVPGHTTILDNDALIDGVDRQSELKAETLAQIGKSTDVTAINLGRSAAKLGQGVALQLNRLSGGKFTSGSINGTDLQIDSIKMSGPFAILGVTNNPSALAGSLGVPAVENDRSIGALLTQAQVAGKTPIVMIDGDRDDAVAIARSHPELRLIQYNSVGRPSQSMETIGNACLITTGEKGKYVVRVEFDGESFKNYGVVTLSPEVRDDPAVAKLYKTYLDRVGADHLLEKLPRTPTESYAGSWTCQSCHLQPERIWKNSHHRFAYQTLEEVGHQLDPDCVSCHVVGLESTKGFRSKATTPNLAGVGCESCHGPALKHALKPTQYRMAKLDEKACTTCHNVENSPNFNFKAYWQKIKH